MLKFRFFLSHAKKVAWHLYVLFMSDLVSASHNTMSFDFFAVHEFLAFSVVTTFLLPVSFVAVLKLFRPRIHISEWVQDSSSCANGELFICLYPLRPFHSLETLFACTLLFAVSELLRHRLIFKFPRSLCLSLLLPLIKIMIYGHSLFGLKTITSGLRKNMACKLKIRFLLYDEINF